MSLKINETREAAEDAIQTADYIAEQSGFNASDRFLAAVMQTYKKLADMLGLGVLRDYNNPAYAGMRMWHITRYSKYLVFYRANDEEVKIIRVLHGARDLYAIFAPEDEE